MSDKFLGFEAFRHDYGGYAHAIEPGLDNFVKKAAEVKRLLPSLFGIKLVNFILFHLWI